MVFRKVLLISIMFVWMSVYNAREFVFGSTISKQPRCGKGSIPHMLYLSDCSCSNNEHPSGFEFRTSSTRDNSAHYCIKSERLGLLEMIKYMQCFCITTFEGVHPQRNDSTWKTDGMVETLQMIQIPIHAVIQHTTNWPQTSCAWSFFTIGHMLIFTIQFLTRSSSRMARLHVPATGCVHSDHKGNMYGMQQFHLRYFLWTKLRAHNIQIGLICGNLLLLLVQDLIKKAT